MKQYPRIEKDKAFKMLIDLSYNQEMAPDKWKRYFKWIADPHIKFLMRPYLKDREFAMLVPGFEPEEIRIRSTRMLNAPNVQSLDFFYKVTGLLDKFTIYNFYNSVAIYRDGLPKIPYNRDARSEANVSWVADHWKTMTSYDLFIDIDGTVTDLDWSIFSAKSIRDLFVCANIPFYFRWSGNGFHFIVPYLKIKDSLKDFIDDTSFDPDSDNNIYKVYGKIASYLNIEYSELIDQSIYDPRRLIKTPYSIVHCEDGFRVCLPINARELTNFSLDWVTPLPTTNDTISRAINSPDILYNPNGNGDGLARILHKIRRGKISHAP